MSDGKGNQESVMNWLASLRDGDAEAAQKIWDHFFQRLHQHARNRLAGTPQNVADPEDIVVSAFESLWRAAQHGRLDNVANADELLWLLLALTRRKAANHVRHASAEKRGGKMQQYPLLDDDDPGSTYRSLLSVDPDPTYVVSLKEELERVLGLLRDDQLRRIAVLRLEGYSHSEICDRVGLSPATVTRKLRLIRKTWAEELES